MTIKRWFAALLLTVTLPVSAGEVSGLFEAEVAVVGMSDQERGAGIVSALESVVRKVTGRPHPTMLESWGRLVSAAPGLVQQYRYTADALPVPTTEMADEMAPDEQLRLWVKFDAAALDDFLRRVQLPVWGSVRPTTLVLIAVEDGNERSLLGIDGDTMAIEALDDAQSQRGVPLMLPLMDIEDRSVIRFADVWGDFPAPVKTISERYAPDAILVGRLFRGLGERWSAQWTLHAEDGAHAWTSAGTHGATIAAGIDQLADRLAERFAPDPMAGDHRMDVRIVGVQGFADYVRVLRYLEALSPVVAVDPVRVSRPEMVVELTARATLDGLIQLAELGEVLAAEPFNPEADNLATFRLLP